MVRIAAGLLLLSGLGLVGYALYAIVTGSFNSLQIVALLLGSVLLAAGLGTLIVSMKKRSVNERPAPKDARIGLGTVTSASPTGLQVNDHPQLQLALEVLTAEGGSFAGVAKQIVAPAELALTTPGRQLPVLYDPNRQDGTVWIALNRPVEAVQEAIARVQLAHGQITPGQLRAGLEGEPAQAVVLETKPTGEIRGGRSVLSLQLQVTRADGGQFSIVVERPVAPSSVPSLQPGSVLQVRFLPGEENELAILQGLVR